MFDSILSFNSETRMKLWFQSKCAELGRSCFEEWLQNFFDKGGEVYVDGEPCGYWACWGAGVLGERPVAEKWELDVVGSWSTSEIKNRIWSNVSTSQPIPGCISLLALRLELMNRGEDPHGYHNT